MADPLMRIDQARSLVRRDACRGERLNSRQGAARASGVSIEVERRVAATQSGTSSQGARTLGKAEVWLLLIFELETLNSSGGRRVPDDSRTKILARVMGGYKLPK